jgi:hypothetical protein
MDAEDDCGCGCGGHGRKKQDEPHECGCGGHDREAKTQEHVCDCGGREEPVDHGCGCGGVEESHSCTCGGHEAAAVRPAGHGGAVYWSRRVHALSGALFALFLTMHLIVNASAWNVDLFCGNIGLIRLLHQTLPWLIGAAIFLPLLTQVSTGLYLLLKAGLRYQTGGCNRGSTPRYFLQRLSALFVLAFVTMHLGVLHGWGFHAVPHGPAAHGLAGYDPAHVLFGGALAALPFLFGIWAVAFHLANGAISGARVWGLFRDPAVWPRWRIACLISGIALAFAGLLAWTAFFRSAA